MLNSILRVPFFVGWILAGVCIGASLGVYDLLRGREDQGRHARRRSKKTLNGIYGGFLGGLLGGILFGLLDSATRTSRAPTWRSAW